jgi:hypothetical protein
VPTTTALTDLGEQVSDQLRVTGAIALGRLQLRFGLGEPTQDLGDARWPVRRGAEGHQDLFLVLGAHPEVSTRGLARHGHREARA